MVFFWLRGGFGRWFLVGFCELAWRVSVGALLFGFWGWFGDV